MNKTDSLISKLEAMLFAAGDPVEASKLAEVLDIDIESVTKMLGHLGALYDERESGLMLIKIDNKYQLCTREKHSEEFVSSLKSKKIHLSVMPRSRFSRLLLITRQLQGLLWSRSGALIARVLFLHSFKKA